MLVGLTTRASPTMPKCATDEVINETLKSLANPCPNLQSVYLHNRLLSDLELQAFFQHCPKWESFTICSNGINTNGNLQGSALKVLRKNSDWAPNLWKLCIDGYDDKNKKLKRAIGKLSAARPDLFISTENKVTQLSSKLLGGHEDIISLEPDTDTDASDDNEEEGGLWTGLSINDMFPDSSMLDSDTDASDEDPCIGYDPTLDMDMADEMFGDSSLGDSMFNQYASGNDMHGYIF